MKRIIYLVPLALLSCGQSQEEINQKRIADSTAKAVREMAIHDSVQKINDSIAKVNANRLADSLANVLNESLKEATK